MIKHLLFLSGIIICACSAYAQVEQVERYELEKKNTDDFCTVLTTPEDGVVYFRDFNREFSFGNKVDGDEWEIAVLDEQLEEVWKDTLTMEYDYVFKAFNLHKSHLYLLFRDGDYEKSDYQLLDVDLRNHEVQRHDIENELALELSHITTVDNYLVIAGYIRNSPTVVSYKIGDKTLEVIPGFFKDRSHILDLRNNDNNTFTVLTLEKDYQNYFMRLRTYSKEGSILFEREIDVQDKSKVLGGKVTDFVNGNINISGPYGGKNSYYSRGIFFAIARPEGQRMVMNYIDFTDLDHFFDYLGEKRAARIKRRIERKDKKGKEYKYNSRLLMHEVHSTSDGFYVIAEIYDPRFENRNNRAGYYSRGYLDPGFNSNYYQNANYEYVKQPNRLTHIEDANYFEYKEAVVLKLNKEGELMWDQSMTIDEVETASLDPTVDVAIEQEKVLMLYRNEENLNYELVVNPDSTLQESQPIKLLYANDEIKHNYGRTGGAEHWYDNNFIIWGYHKIGNNNNEAIDKRRNVMFINKVRFE